MLTMENIGRSFDLEQPRVTGMPTHPAHQPGYSYQLHRRHEDEYDPDGETGSRSGASGLIVCMELNMFDPDLVVVGGSTMKVSDLILEPAVRVVKRRALSEMAEKARIVAGDLDEDAGAIGAAALVLRELFALSVPHDSVTTRHRTDYRTR